MKILIFVSTIIILVACSSNSEKQTAAKLIAMENQIDSLKSAVRTAEIKLESTVNTKTIQSKFTSEDKLTAVTKEYQALLLTTSWYKGRELPFEPMLVGLEKTYKITDFVVWFAKSDEYKRTYQILLPNEWNMEDVTKIKTIIMKTFKFEPSAKNIRMGESTQLKWTGSTFDVELYESVNNKIGLNFILK